MTTLLDEVMGDKKKALNKWRARVGHEEATRISVAATTRGTSFHSSVEDYLNNRLDISSLDPFEADTFENARSTLDRIDNIRFTERGMFSMEHRIAGTVDCIAEFDGVLSIIDHKTSRAEKKESWIESYFLQETGYALMYEELTGIKVNQIVTIISVKEHHTAQVFVKQTQAYIPKLKSLITEYYRTNV